MASPSVFAKFATFTSKLSAMEESRRMDAMDRILSMMEDSSSSDDSRSLRSKITYIVEEYGFKESMKRFFYNLITEEPQDAMNTLYEESGLKESHPAIDYKTKAYNIVMDLGYDGTPMETFFKNIPNVGVDKAVEELYTECL